MTQPQSPSVGRIVHYVSYGTPGGEYPSTCRAAVVTEAPGRFAQDLAVGLCVLNPTGHFFNRGVPWSGGREARGGLGDTRLCEGRAYDGGTWHWPERV